MQQEIDLDKAIRKIPNYPKEGILFYDITGILTKPPAFQYCISRMVEIYKNKQVEAVAGIEARGFIFAAPLADQLGIPLILVRKGGKLPGKVYRQDYKLEYGDAAVEIHISDIPANKNVVLIDDLIATGGTLRAARKLLEQGGAFVKFVFGIIGLTFLDYQDNLPGLEIDTLIEYQGEHM